MVKFPSRYEFRGLVILYGDPIDPMVLCVYRDTELVAAAEFTLMGGTPERMEVECDLDLLAALGQTRFCGSPSWIDEKRREMAADGAARRR